MESFLIDQLTDGDLRTIGVADSVVKVAMNQPELIPEIVAALEFGSPGLRMRSADVLEKISFENPQLLQPFKDDFIAIGRATDQNEVQWHMGLILPRLELSEMDADAVEAILIRYLASKRSAIVRVSAVEGLARLAIAFPARYDRCLDRIVKAMEGGAPSVVARGKKMIRLLSKHSGSA
jgi:hypothetical protein